MEKQQENTFVQGKILQPLIVFALPVLFTLFLQAMYGAVDLLIVAYNLIGCIFRGLGDSRTPLLTVAIACVCNIAGDLLLCAGLGLGTAGAAIATVAAQVVSVVVSLAVIRKKELPFEMHRTDIRLHGKTLRRTAGLGAPIALQDLLVSVSFLIILYWPSSTPWALRRRQAWAWPRKSAPLLC